MPQVRHVRKVNTEFVPNAVPAEIRNPQPKISFVTVTPEVANLWLTEKNNKNRPLREAWAIRMSEDMKAGKWHGQNGEAVRIDTGGRLVDGQHRLRACILAGVPFETVLITDVAPEDYLTIGIGAAKSVGDLIGPMNGEKNTALLGAVLRLVYMWGHGTLGKSEKYSEMYPTVVAMEQVYRDHPNLPESVSWVANNKPVRRILTPSFGALIHYAGTLENKSASVTSFLERLGSGLGLLDDDPVYHLRSFLLSLKGPAPGRRRPGRTYVLAMAVKSWNSAKNEQRMKQLRWNPAREEFPQL